jgi:hypothetical protein
VRKVEDPRRRLRTEPLLPTLVVAMLAVVVLVAAIGHSAGDWAVIAAVVLLGAMLALVLTAILGQLRDDGDDPRDGADGREADEP